MSFIVLLRVENRTYAEVHKSLFCMATLTCVDAFHLQEETQKMDDRLQMLRQMLTSSKSQYEDVTKKNGGTLWQSARPVPKNCT